jgi:hypothetical protein
MDAITLRRFIQKVYCQFDFFKLAELYGYVANEETLKDPYLKEKWGAFRKDWTTWYCNLDDFHANKFLELLND